MNNYIVLHSHTMLSNPYSGLTVDSLATYQQYIDRAKECGMSAIAITEHGSVLANIGKKQYCEKNGIKFIHGAEFYLTETLDKDNLVRDNYHCILLAANEDGIREINKLSSISMNRTDGHYYYNPRISIEELEKTSDNVFVLTACVTSALCKGTPEMQERFLNFIVSHKNRCWLEIQPHNFDLQIQYNKYLYNISKKYGLKLVATSDVHALNTDQMEGRKIEQKSHDVKFNDEDACDLTWKTYDEMCQMFAKQRALPEDVYLEALEETNRIADMIQDRDLDYSKKYPRLYKDSDKEFRRRIIEGIKERGIDKLPNYATEYKPRIKEEYKTFKHNDAIDFMLLDADYKVWMLKNGMHYGLSRGSGSGSICAYLLHNTDVDSIRFNLNFSRFMNTERVSLADIDSDLYAPDRYKVREYLFEREGLYCCNIVTYNTVKTKNAIKDVARALGFTPDEAQNLSDRTILDEKGNDVIPDDMRNELPGLCRFVDIINGTITSIGRHAAGIVCSPTDVEYDFGTLSITSDPRPVSQVDMHEIDSLNFVKLDLLGLNAVGLIDQTCKLAGIDYLTPDNVDLEDENVWKSIAEDTTMIFQFESGYASDSLKKVLSEETIANIKKQNDHLSKLDLMAMCSGAIRPAGSSYREQLFRGEYHDNGNKQLNDMLAPTLGFLVYQEQIIEFLHKFCGYTMGQADVVRRHFAKKTGTESDIPIIENGGYMIDNHGNKDSRYIKGFIATMKDEYGVSEDNSKEIIKSFLQVIIDASSYLFSKNHSDPYSMLGYFIGYLRYYHPLELLTAALNIYQDNKNKSEEILKYIASKNIKINNVKYGYSRSNYYMDENTNSIYKGISSINNIGESAANELCELYSNKYDSFVDFLFDVQKTSVTNRMLDILIKIDFFEEFGDINYLLQVVDIFNVIIKKKQFTLNDAEKFGITEEELEINSNKRTAKTFKELNHKGIINLLASKIYVTETPISTKIRYEIECLGSPISIFPNINKRYYIVKDVKSSSSLVRASLYELYSGKTRDVKMWANQCDLSTVTEGSCICINRLNKKNKRQPSDQINPKTGKKIWVDIPNEYEYWLESYSKIEDIEGDI